MRISSSDNFDNQHAYNIDNSSPITLAYTSNGSCLYMDEGILTFWPSKNYSNLISYTKTWFRTGCGH